MKKILTFLLLVITLQVFSQTYPITAISISLPANPDASMANWGSGTSLFTITANAKAANGRVDGRVTESKILVTIKKGGAKVCGSFTANSAPVSNLNTLTKVWSGSNAVSLLGKSCVLPAGEYELTVQFFGVGAAGLAPLSEEKIKPFSIRAKEQLSYQPPQAIAPANGTVLSEIDIKKPITFRWTPVIPRPQEPVTYRLKVWQLMQGQNGAQAMATNQPIITKDVDNLTQTMITNLSSGPCLAPYLCDYIWNVQALNREGKPVGGNNGMSEALKFNVQPVNNSPSIIALVFPANGFTISAKDKPKFTWTFKGLENNYSSGSNQLYKIKIVEIIGDQSPELALRTNKPHFEKDSLKEISFQYPSSERNFTGVQKYAWNVQALNRDGKPIGTNNGTSEPFTFRIPEIACGTVTNSSKIECGRADPKTGVRTYTVSITLTNTSKDCKLVLTSLNAANGGVITPPGVAFPITIAPNTSITVSFNYTPAPSAITLASFTLDGGWNGDRNASVTIPIRVDLPPCKSTQCLPEQKSWSPLGTGLNGEVRALAVMGTDLYVAGNFTTAGGISANRIAKWDGSNWSPLGSGLVGGEVQSLLVVGSDLYAGGYFTTAGGIPAKHIAKWNGTSWQTLGAGTSGTVRALAMIGNTLYAGGQFTTAGTVSAKNVASWNGSTWSAMGAGLTATNGVVNSFTVQGGTLYAGGHFLSSASTSTPFFAKWNGSSWVAAATGQTSTVKAIIRGSNGIYVGGALTIPGIPNTNKIVKWDGTNWSALGTGTNFDVWSLAVNGSDVYAGGEFTTAGGTAISHIAKWNGTSWSALGTGVNATTLAISLIGNDLYAAGNFSSAGGVPANNIAKYSCIGDKP